MSDNYLTSDSIDAHLGADVRAAVEEAVGTGGLTLLSQVATSFVQGSLRNSGYELPTEATMQGASADLLVQLAVSAALRELIAGIPNISLPLPEAWDKNVAKVALAGILSGDTQLGLPQRDIDAPGGWSVSTSTAGTKPQRTSRCELSGY